MKTIDKLISVTTFCAVNLMSVTSALSADISSLGSLNQSGFSALSKDLAAATNGNPMEPAAPLGISGFDLSGAVTMTNTQAATAWSQSTGDSMSRLMQTKIMVTKGLPWGLDVGSFVSQFANTNVSASGFHVKYALLEGNVVSPAVSVRSSYSRTGGASQLNVNNTAFDVLISKGFVGFTPYAGVGTVRSNAKVNGVSNLNNESFSQAKSFVGLSMNMTLINLTAEYERVGSTSTLGVKAGLRF